MTSCCRKTRLFHMPLAAFPKCFLDAMCVSREMSVDQWIDMSLQFDIDGLEFYWHFTPWNDPDRLEVIRRRVNDQGRSIPMMCYSPDFTKPDPVERKQEVLSQKQAIQICAVLGVKYCRVLSGQRRPEVSRDQGITWVSQCIRELLPFAEGHGVVLILENHYKDNYWVYPEFAQKTDVFLQLLDVIEKTPWFGVNFDPSNAVIAGEDPIELLEATKGRVVSMHASDRYFEGGTLEDLRKTEANPSTGYASILKHGVVGKGLNDYDKIFSILRDAGFKGWVSIEDGADPRQGVQDLADSAVFLRRKMREYGLP
jgi:sugar phosphate isomerase/epimerase